MSAALYALVREVAASHVGAHPHKLARLVAEATDPSDMLDFYVAALEKVVADMIRTGRNATMNNKQGRSAKLADRVSWWQRMLREQVSVGGGVWKLLGDCTIDDLFYCISERRDQIAAIECQIVKYETIAAAMREHGVDTVGQLPDGAVQL